MNEKDKMVDIILIADITERTADEIADNLIENGYGNVAEWKEKYAKLEKSDTSKENCTIEQHEEIHYLRDKLKQTEKECAELREQVKFYKETTKVKILPNGEMVFEKQAEKEIEEERKQ